MKKLLFIVLLLSTCCFSFVYENNYSLRNGDKAPCFKLEDVHGDTISLEDLKGDYILIDFWASWCAPCRKENPNILEAYHLFADKGFKVVGVSLDKNARKWKSAIETDSLQEFIHVSELVSSMRKSKVAKDYQVSYIPQNFLINPKGKIVAKNLKGRELKLTLSKYLN